ncbi:MAG: histidine--tRNA ligase [Bacteriovoracaceae bacterium]
MALNKSPYKGTRDFFPQDMRLRNFIFGKMAEVSELYSYEAYDGPLLEEVELYLAKSGEELISEQIYSFNDRGDRHVAIRPEMTPTVARMVAQIHRETIKPLRWYSTPNLMRYEKMQKGRLREFWQYNADIFGAPEGLGEIEILQLAVSLIASFGGTNEMFEILVNDRRFVDLVFTGVLGCTDDEKYKLYKLVDRSGKISAEKLEADALAILGDNQKVETFKKYLATNSIEGVLTWLKSDSTETGASIKAFFEKIKTLGLDQYVKFDATIVRGLDYYTGMVFEIFDKHPDNRRAIAGGGAFANLLQIFNEPALPGVGFGLGDVTFTDFLKIHNLLPDLSKPEVDILISYMDLSAETASFELSSKLRDLGLKTELYLGEAKPKKVFGYAEKRGHQFAAIIGADEIAKNEIQFKNLITRETHTIALNDVDKMSQIAKKGN